MGIKDIDTFEIEEMIADANMSIGNIDAMAEQIQKLGSALAEKELAYQSYVSATADSVSSATFDKITNTAFKYQHDYMHRFTTEEMEQTLESVGFSGVGAVVIDADWAEEAVWNGKEVFALKDGNMEYIEKPGIAKEYEKDGYVLAVSPHTYESEFLNDLQNSIE